MPMPAPHQIGNLVIALAVIVLFGVFSGWLITLSVVGPIVVIGGVFVWRVVEWELGAKFWSFEANPTSKGLAELEAQLKRQLHELNELEMKMKDN